MEKKWMAAALTLLVSVATVSGAGGAIIKEKQKDIVNVAHRGASGYAPEHTLVSYELGEKLKGDYIEIDLQMTKDGQLIAMHDETLDRTTNGAGKVKDVTLAEIKQLDAGSWFNKAYPQYAKSSYKGLTVPTLEEIFQKFGQSKRYYIETKSPKVYPGMEEKLVYLIEKYGIDKRKLFVQSFSAESLSNMHELDPSLRLIQLLWYTTNADITDEEIADIQEYAIGIGPNYTFINKKYVEKITNSGLQIHPYTVNDKKTMKMLMDWGVTGMFTNFPDVLYEVKNGK